MWRKLGLAIAYFVAIVYVFSIVLPGIYCLQHGCNGPELDAFMPAFLFTPAGIIATALSLRDAIRKIKRDDEWSWVFWPLAIIFATVLAGAIALVAWVILETAFHRPR